MSDTTPPIPASTTVPAPAADENVQRGAIFALGAIPIGMVAFAVVAGLFGFITGVVAIVIPYVAAFLYGKGAGAPLTRKGWGPFILVAGAAVVLGTFTGIVAGAFYVYQAVGGSGGIFASAFWRTVVGQFTTNLADNLFGIIIGLALGAAGIASVLRGGRRLGASPVAAPPAPPVDPNQPSPGVMLNGEPVDPDAKPKQ